MWSSLGIETPRRSAISAMGPVEWPSTPFSRDCSSCATIASMTKSMLVFAPPLEIGTLWRHERSKNSATIGGVALATNADVPNAALLVAHRHLDPQPEPRHPINLTAMYIILTGHEHGPTRGNGQQSLANWGLSNLARYLLLHPHELLDDRGRTPRPRRREARA